MICFNNCSSLLGNVITGERADEANKDALTAET